VEVQEDIKEDQVMVEVQEDIEEDQMIEINPQIIEIGLAKVDIEKEETMVEEIEKEVEIDLEEASEEINSCFE